MLDVHCELRSLRALRACREQSGLRTRRTCAKSHAINLRIIYMTLRSHHASMQKVCSCVSVFVLAHHMFAVRDDFLFVFFWVNCCHSVRGANIKNEDIMLASAGLYHCN